MHIKTRRTDGVHESIATSALRISRKEGYAHVLNRSFKHGLKAGVRWNDVPEGVTSTLFLAMDHLKRGLRERFTKKQEKRVDASEEVRAKKEKQRILTRRSHYGDLTWLHSMASTRNGHTSLDKNKNAELLSAEEIREKQKEFAKAYFDKSLIIYKGGDCPNGGCLCCNSRFNRNYENAGFHLGPIIHMLSDSYSPSHTERDYREEHWPIVRYQNYQKQEAVAGFDHKLGDAFGKPGSLQAAAIQYATYQTVALLSIFGEAVKDPDLDYTSELDTLLDSIFLLAPNASSDGVAPVKYLTAKISDFQQKEA